MNRKKFEFNFFESYSSLSFSIRVFSIVGSKALREGKDYVFSVVSSDLNSSLNARFSLSGWTEDRKALRWTIGNIRIRSNEMKNYIFRVSCLVKKFHWIFNGEISLPDIKFEAGKLQFIVYCKSSSQRQILQRQLCIEFFKKKIIGYYFH